jgi:hypothetical protein
VYPRPRYPAKRDWRSLPMELCRVQQQVTPGKEIAMTCRLFCLPCSL